MTRIYNFTLVILIILISNLYVNAQDYYYAVYEGDTIELSIISPNGTVQWQQTDDTLTSWTNIVGATASPYDHITEASGTGFKYYRVEITNLTVCVAPWYSEIIKHKIITSTVDLAIGDYFGGGIVCYSDGGSGRIVSGSDQGMRKWGCEGELVEAFSSVDGLGNTMLIIDSCYEGTELPASVCNDLTLNGYSDWYLPSKTELSLLYDNRSLIPGITNNYYWSSTEYDAVNSWRQHLVTGVQSYYDKSYTWQSRCIRYFSSPTPPTITLDSIININPVSAKVYANVIDDGGATVTERGICWATTTNPTLSDSTAISGAGAGQFEAMATLLTASTTYYVRAYATNSVGTSYSTEQSFTTTADFPNCGTVTDYDGNVYETVIIGDQCWMRENLNVGTMIAGLPSDNGNIEKACYSNEIAKCDTFGGLYHWSEMMQYATVHDAGNPGATQGICPNGWHIPTKEEWKRLLIEQDVTCDYANTVLRNLNIGDKLIDNTMGLWNNNVSATNESGFSVLPAGIITDSGEKNIYTNSYFWTATNFQQENTEDYAVWNAITGSNSTLRQNYISTHGYNKMHSVRCVKNPTGAEIYIELEIAKRPCLDMSDGMLGLTVSGGNSPYSFLWSDGTTDQNRVNISNGTYEVTVIDVNGGIGVNCITIYETGVPPREFSIESISCWGSNNGAVNFTLSDNNAPYSYNWSTGDITKDINSIDPGVYSVTVTDSHGCTSIDSVEITEPTEISLAFSNTHINFQGGNNGAIDLTITEGTPSYTYEWSNTETTEDISNLTQGWYKVTITDNNSCVKVDSTQINEMNFPCLGIPTVTDYDGNVYETVTIGDQCWMKENLKTTHYDNGDVIPIVTDQTAWGNLSITDKAYCFYDNSVANRDIYGSLYTWSAVMDGDGVDNYNTVQGVCPTGWHLPSNFEYEKLSDYLGGENIAGGKMKTTDTIYWNNPNVGATNSSGFSALPGGRRIGTEFREEKEIGRWWTSTDFHSCGWYKEVVGDYEFAPNGQYQNRNIGLSVRCVKNSLLSQIQQRLDLGETPKQIFDSGIPLDSIYGKIYQGGLIFYLDTVVGTGFVAAIKQNIDLPWGCVDTTITGADDVVIGSGLQNTIDIESECLSSGTAADHCANLLLSGYSDWFLPSKDELYAMYNNLFKKGYGLFGMGYYWSSSESSSSHAWIVRFEYGAISDNFKNDSNASVRPIRAF